VHYDATGQVVGSFVQPIWAIDSEIVDSRQFAITHFYVLRDGRGLVVRNDGLKLIVVSKDGSIQSEFDFGVTPATRYPEELAELRAQLKFTQRMIRGPAQTIEADRMISDVRLVFKSLDLTPDGRLYFVGEHDAYRGEPIPIAPSAPVEFRSMPQITYRPILGAHVVDSEMSHLGSIRFPAGVEKVAFGVSTAWGVSADSSGSPVLLRFDLPF